MYLLGFLQISILTSLPRLGNSANPTDIYRLRADVLRNYDNHSRPVQSHKDAVELKIHFLINGFQFDDQTSIITMHLVTVMSWEDQHLKWDPLNYGNISEITFAPHELWIPDMSLINNYLNSEIDHFGNSLIIGTNDSEIWWIPPTKFQVGCDTNYRLWPYDKVYCTAIVTSWTHNGEEIDINVREGHTQLETDPDWQIFVENREWKIISSSVVRVNDSFCCPEIPYMDIYVSMGLERKASSHTIAVVAVGLGIATIILISFWLDPFAQERIPLTLLVILLNVIYLQYMHRAIPNNGESVPLIVCFFRDSLIMVTFALVWTVGIRYIAKTKRYAPVPLPSILQTFLSSFGAKLLCLNPRPTTKIQAQRKQAENSEEDGDVSELVQEDTSSIQEDWEWLARLLDRVAFFAYLITYTIFILAFL